jgi:hypothetical protein
MAGYLGPSPVSSSPVVVNHIPSFKVTTFLAQVQTSLMSVMTVLEDVEHKVKVLTTQSTVSSLFFNPSCTTPPLAAAICDNHIICFALGRRLRPAASATAGGTPSASAQHRCAHQSRSGTFFERTVSHMQYTLVRVGGILGEELEESPEEPLERKPRRKDGSPEKRKKRRKDGSPEPKYVGVGRYRGIAG